MRSATTRCRKSPQRRQGFTLVEMMIVISIIGIMAAISTPPLFRYVQSHRLQTDTDRIVADLHLARAMSVANSQVLQLQATAAGYAIVDPVTNDVVRDHVFDHGLALDADFTVNFFPWGMADATTLTLSNPTGARQIDVLPTGMVEVN